MESIRSLLVTASMFSLCLTSSVADATRSGKAWVGGPVHADGTEVHVDFPHDRWLKNVGGSDGAGLCVFTSAVHAADWACLRPVLDFRKWMEQRPGGGTPKKFQAMLESYCRERRIAVPDYYQIQDTTGAELDLLAEAVQSGHMVGVTYCWSPTGRYQGQTIAHMVNCVAARAGKDRLWCILDNNYVAKPTELEWMTESDFKRSYLGLGYGWAIIFLRPGPPPPPRLPSEG